MPPRLELMPLLDVVFLLLTFFAFALLVMVRAEVLDVQLPIVEAGRSAADSRAPVVVTITEDGALAVDREPVDDAAVIERLKARQAEQEDFSILLEVDVGAPSGRLIELVQTLRAAGFDRFGVLGSRPDQPPADASAPASPAPAPSSSASDDAR